MKRWIAAILAAALLLAAVPAGAQEPAAVNAATLAENLGFLRDMMENEDVRSLIQMRDVQDLMSEVVVKVLIWMLQNRETTMEILKELGIGETDLRCIGKLWDSADRVRDAWRRYSETEDGRRLAAEAGAVAEDPVFNKAVDDFLKLASSGDIASIVDALRSAMREEMDEAPPEGGMTQEALARRLDRSTLTGTLFLQLMGLVEKSDWARSSLPALMENENLWKLIVHLSETKWLDEALREEARILGDDPEIPDFLQRTAEAAVYLIRDLSEAEEPPEQDAGSAETVGEVNP